MNDRDRYVWRMAVQHVAGVVRAMPGAAEKKIRRPDNYVPFKIDMAGLEGLAGEIEKLEPPEDL